MRVAFVVQRYGLEVNGGAELYCRKIAERLSRRFSVEVLTTCAIDYQTWKNEYKPGIHTVNGITVRRFPVDGPRRKMRFGLLSRVVFGGRHPERLEVSWMKAQGPYSSALFEFIDKEKGGYDCFVFITYLYCTTFFGLPLVREKAVLVPTAEDAPPLRLGIFKRLFNSPSAIVYCAPEEKALVNRLFGNEGLPSDIIGTGIDMPVESDGERFRAKFAVADKFIVYVGRITPDKACGEMFAFFSRYKEERPGGLKLVLIGRAFMDVPAHPDIIQAGFVSEEDKFDALCASSMLLMPSRFESLSIVLIEAWFSGRPVIVNAGCDVTRGQVERSGGGLAYDGYEAFRDAIDRLLGDERERGRLAESGRAFAEATYGWESVEGRYAALIESVCMAQGAGMRRTGLKTIPHG